MADVMVANRVLLAEDNADVTRLLAALLDAEPDFECAGHVARVADIAEAIERLGVDALILDLKLGGASSVPFLAECRERYPNLIVVIFSGHSNPGLIREVCAQGAHDYLVKPNDLDVLVVRLRSLLNNHPR